MSNDTLALAPAGTATPMLRAEPIAVALDVAPLPNADYRSMLRLGLWVLLVGFGGFLLWAFLAPLDEGIPAPGLVSVESSRKRVDHASGGIIEQILVDSFTVNDETLFADCPEIPEPVSLVLFSAGLAGVGLGTLVRRRAGFSS